MRGQSRSQGWLRRARAVLGFAAAFCAAAPASAATFYVRAGGNNAQNGRSAATALASIKVAAERVGGGDTVIVGPGRYAEGNITPRGNGRRGEVVRFVADRSGQRTGDAPGDVMVDATGFDVGFRISSRPYVVVDGFTVANANAEGISVKSSSDGSVVSNCIVVSNRGRGVWVRDSRRVVVFNNLVYANNTTGIDFGGENGGSPDGTAVNNTVFGNGLDGIRIEGLSPSPRATVVQNVIAQNLGSGINLKERSVDGFVGQWNLNIDGYGSEATKSAFDFSGAPLLVAPTGGDQQMGVPFHVDDDFRLRQLAAGQPEQSSAVDGSPMSSKALQLAGGSTNTAGQSDQGRADLGFHYGNGQDFVSGRKSVTQRVRALRKRGAKCERLGRRSGGGAPACVGTSLQKVRRLCGPLAEQICS
jgi:parallel beta-helix repeat protein